MPTQVIGRQPGSTIYFWNTEFVNERRFEFMSTGINSGFGKLGFWSPLLRLSISNQDSFKSPTFSWFLEHGRVWRLVLYKPSLHQVKKNKVIKYVCGIEAVVIFYLELGVESPLDWKEIQPVLGVHWRDWCWSWNSNTLATWCGELTHLKRPWC